MCIDLMLTKSCRISQNSCATKNGFSDFHKKIVTVMKIYYQTQKPKIINFCEQGKEGNE